MFLICGWLNLRMRNSWMWRADWIPLKEREKRENNENISGNKELVKERRKEGRKEGSKEWRNERRQEGKNLKEKWWRNLAGTVSESSCRDFEGLALCYPYRALGSVGALGTSKTSGQRDGVEQGSLSWTNPVALLECKLSGLPLETQVSDGRVSFLL